MLIKARRGWEIPEGEATPEQVFLDRRRFVAALGLGAGIAGTGLAGGTAAQAQGRDPTADLYPAKRNEAFRLDREVTPEKVSAEYNNYYEFSTSKAVTPASDALKTRPWTVKIGGLVEAPMEVGFDDLIRRMPLEERLYRMRCVEAWSMAVPWTGFPLRALVDMAKPTSAAKYVVMQTFHDKAVAPGQKQFWYPWPYTEGLTIDEARNDLALLVTGVYGKPLPNQFGAPLRLAVPWKSGFKSVKAINPNTITAERPKTFWEELQASEYGFWANVNPAVPHPRWSQAEERILGTGDRRPTLLFNGYGEQVAELYKDLQKERLWA
ncbi:protein-methionine-sulfoxide reductase catalytic subunit MsrP [Enterovirga sp.]|uniref:protein-methionine-sulfoxide reductase catalytic subunit MsrP n=1 Tax=Enterovirga sp. TaxID=2026350 RepID=UPI0026120BB9|nr:protein-methionine-sulfoxide reductase catalytic subunit MsrP [Enterovirga sp.]MDB5591594.1 protein-methionine-sulfoxide reductase catalytic subunit MsrP [Enterovirga sp.]